MNFEWDKEKERKNQEKHGVSFSEAARVFLDRKRIDKTDENHSEFEERRNTIGMIGKILFVVYTERKESVRIISARKATKEEQREYYRDYDIR